MECKPQAEFVRELGLGSAAAIVVGSMIGSGIFIAPSLMAGYIQTPGLLVLLWVVGGLLTMAAALCLGELAAAFPRAGGQYVFLREAFSPLWGFLYGWTLFLVIQTGFIAAVAIAFSKYLGVFFPALGEQKTIFSLTLFRQSLSLSSAQLAALACIALLTGVNILGVRHGARVQNLFTVAKVAAMLLLVGAAFLLGHGRLANFRPLLAPVLPAGATLPLFAALAVAMSKALFAYDSWNSVTFVAEEVRDPRRNLPRAMILGAGAVMLIYTLITMAYLYIIPAPAMAGVVENRIGAAVAQQVLGAGGLTFITLAILVSTFGCVNGLVLSGPRLYYAMARDGLFFRRSGALHARFCTPHHSLLLQGAWSGLLVLSGSYSDLLTYTAFASLLFNALTVAGLMRLRRRRPELERPYRAWGYPLVPVLYVLVALFFIAFIVVGDPLNSGKGLFLVLCGLPVYAVWRRRAAPVDPGRAQRQAPEA